MPNMLGARGDGGLPRSMLPPFLLPLHAAMVRNPHRPPSRLPNLQTNPGTCLPRPASVAEGSSSGSCLCHQKRTSSGDWRTQEVPPHRQDYDVELVVAHVEACIRAAPTGEGSQGWSDAVMAAVQPFVGLHAPQFVKEFTAFFSAGGGRRLAQHAAESSPPFESPARGEAEDTHVGGWDDM
eukprot:jgi/Mesvir1/6785/Mv18970-RA.1